jgi:hypothetical protein
MRDAHNPSAWPRVRQRFVMSAALAAVLVVGGGATIAWFTGGVAGALIGGGFLLVAITVSLGVAYTRLRRKYLLGV